MHLAFAQGKSEEADACATRLTNDMEDRLSHLSLKVRRGDFEAAAQGYADILASYPEMSALKLYAAVCYSRLELYDVSLELTESYLNGHSDSIGAGVLKACNAYKMHGHEVACSLLSEVCESSTSADRNPLVLFNKAVFERGRDGRRVRHKYIHFIQHDVFFERSGSPLLRPFQKRQPISHCMISTKETMQKLKGGREKVTRNLPSSTSRRYWIDASSHGVPFCVRQGLSYALLGRETQSSARIEEGRQFLQLVGSSETERDTILGRQCMTFYYMTNDQYEEAIVFLESIQDYVAGDAKEIFKWNAAVCFLNMGRYEEAQAQLESIQDDAAKFSPKLLTDLSCHISCCVGQR